MVHLYSCMKNKKVRNSHLSSTDEGEISRTRIYASTTIQIAFRTLSTIARASATVFENRFPHGRHHGAGVDERSKQTII